MSKPKVIVIDDDPIMLDSLRLNLQASGYDVSTAETGEQGLKLAENDHFDVALTDLQLPDLDGIEVVKRLNGSSPNTETKVIMITGHGSIEKAVEATKAGAFDFVEKPFEFDRLNILIKNALELRKAKDEANQLRDRLKERSSYHNIIGHSKAMQDIYEIIESVARSDANILIIGESGTGKELIANAIHYNSLRAKRPFVKVNCAALPKELIESELFGHTKGAFTGATMDKIGLIGQAQGGSLLMDEIAEMPLELQPKLLRVLQERVYYRLGSEKSYDVDFRLISATNRDPLDAMQSGNLREDLYYRVNTIEIRVPPLRERNEDLQFLADHFLNEFAKKYNRPVRSISQRAYHRMFDHPWPGNVRELQNVIERAVLLCKGDAVDAEDLPFERPATVTPVAENTEISPNVPLEQLESLIVRKALDREGGLAPDDLLEQLEGMIVRKALERTKGNKQAAANLLGIYRPRLYSMIKKHDLRDFM